MGVGAQQLSFCRAGVLTFTGHAYSSQLTARSSQLTACSCLRAGPCTQVDFFGWARMVVVHMHKFASVRSIRARTENLPPPRHDVAAVKGY